MSSPNGSPYDLSPATRPTLDTFNGCAKLDDLAFPPDVQTMPSAAEWNAKGKTLISLGKMVGTAQFSVDFSGGAPILVAFSAASNNAIAFVLTRVSGGAAHGDIQITWPAGALPAMVVRPKAWINAPPTAAKWNAPTAVAITNGVRVVTPLDGTATDIPFTVEIP